MGLTDFLKRVFVALVSIPTIIHDVVRISKAWDCIATSRDEEAEKYADAMKLSNATLGPETVVQKASIKLRVRKMDEAATLFDEAWSLIDHDKRLSHDE